MIKFTTFKENKRYLALIRKKEIIRFAKCILYPRSIYYLNKNFRTFYSKTK